MVGPSARRGGTGSTALENKALRANLNAQEMSVVLLTKCPKPFAGVEEHWGGRLESSLRLLRQLLNLCESENYDLILFKVKK